jgi:hypothetical protein
LPSEFYLVHSFYRDFPNENSRTRAYIFVKEKNRNTEELLIVEIADKMNPLAGPIIAPQLKPYAEERMYIKDKLSMNRVEINYMIQLFAWNPDSPSLKPILEKGIKIPHQWALQGQLLFTYKGENVVFFRYSKSINSFGLKLSQEGRDWNKDRLKGNEKIAYEDFKKSFIEMIKSINIKNL